MAAHHFFIDFIKVFIKLILIFIIILFCLLQLTFLNWEKCGLILKPFLIIELWTMIQDWLRFLFLFTIFQVNILILPFAFSFSIYFVIARSCFSNHSCRYISCLTDCYCACIPNLFLFIINYYLFYLTCKLFDRMILSHRQELKSPLYICLLYPAYNVS